MQLKIKEYSEIMPKTTEDILRYLASGIIQGSIIQGIGPQTAKVIVNKFGDKALQVMAYTPEDLLAIPGITQGKLEQIVSSYEEKKHLQKIISMLSPFNISNSKATKIYEKFGSDAVDMLKTRPFKLCDISGFGFKPVDEIAQKFNSRLDDELRIIGAIEYVLNEAAVEGNLYLEKKDLIQKAYALLNNYKEVVSRGKIWETITSPAAVIRFVNDKDCIYKANLYHYENSAAENLIKVMTSRCKIFDKSKILSEIKKSEAALDIPLSPKQAGGIVSSLSNMLSIITGGPGTGKTTLLKVLLAVYDALNPDDSCITLCAYRQGQ